MDEVNVSNKEAEEAKTAQPAAQEAAPKRATRRKAVAKTEAEKKDTEKKARTPRKAAAKTAEKAAATAKKAEEPKKTTRRTASKKAAEQARVIVQFDGRDISTEEVLNRAKAAFAAEKGGVEIKTIDIYVKPEDNAAYYVVNGQENGKIDL